MQRPPWAPEGVDLNRASTARMYDYYLGGSHHLPVDAETAGAVVSMLPQTPAIMRANRRFLRRAVRWSADQGIDQFLDLGAGIPTQGPVHEVARGVRPTARVAYVDRDEVAVAHARHLLRDDSATTVLQYDLSDVDGVLGDPDLTRLIQLNRPVAILLVSVLQFVPDEAEPARIVAAYRDRVAPGSHLILSHATADGLPAEAPAITALYARSGNPIRYRSLPEVRQMFEGFRLVEPGLVSLAQWRVGPVEPDAEDLPNVGAAGVGVR